jgi:Carboxypeptidase regulatory-like domain
MIGRPHALALAVGAWCVVAPAWLSAQANSGEIDGVVTDAQGGVLPGASISAVHLESGYRLERLTDVSGRFFLAPLPVGRYDISITLSGFRSLTQRGVIVLIGQRIHLPRPSRVRSCPRPDGPSGAFPATPPLSRFFAYPMWAKKRPSGKTRTLKRNRART